MAQQVEMFRFTIRVGDKEYAGQLPAINKDQAEWATKCFGAKLDKQIGLAKPEIKKEKGK